MLKKHLIVVIILIYFKLSATKKQLPIGAIFSGEGDELAIAFRSAVERINMQEKVFELQPIIKYGKLEDNFIIEKIVCSLLAQGVIVIFGPNQSSSGIVSSICNLADIPHILFDLMPEENSEERLQHSMTINLYPEGLLLSKAYADIIKSFSWKSFTIIYETDEDLIKMQAVLQIHGPKDNPRTLRHLNEGPDYRPLLKTIKMSGDNCIILSLSATKALNVLRQAQELQMLGEYQNYFIPDLDTNSIDFEDLVYSSANITTVRVSDPNSSEMKNAVHDWEQNEKRQGRLFRTLPERIKTHMLLVHEAVWIFAKTLHELNIAEELSLPRAECKRIRPWQYGRRIIEFLKVRAGDEITGKIEFNEYGQRTFVTLYIQELLNSEFQALATWNPVEGLTTIIGQADAYAKKFEEKLHNKTFIVVSRLGAPFLTLREPKEGEILEGNARFEGYSIDLIDHITRLLGTNYRFYLTPDKGYGNYDKSTKKWNGLVGQLLEGKADLAICDLTITSARRKVVDFSSPFMTLGISILFAKPINEPPDLFSFLLPFSLDVWIYMATAYLGVSLLLFALARMAPDDWENPHPCKEDAEEVENIWTIPNTIWLTMGSIMGQGCDILPKAVSTRLVTGMWWFFALMMLNSYTANLAAFLTMSRMDASIESAEDLAKQSKIKYGAVYGGSTMQFFRDSNFSIYQRMWAAMESARPSVFTKDNNEGEDRVLKGKRMFAFFMESTSIEYIIERNCDLTQVGGWLDYKSYGIALPLNSPYRKPVSEAVLKLGESGKLHELKTKWWKEKYGGGKCSKVEEESTDAAELGVENVGGVFLVLGAGLAVSICIGVLEFLWNVKEVAVEEKITLLEALKLEAMFAVKFWVTSKPIRSSSVNESVESKTSSKSRSRAGSQSRSSNTNLLHSLTYSLKSLQLNNKIKTNTSL